MNIFIKLAITQSTLFYLKPKRPQAQNSQSKDSHRRSKEVEIKALKLRDVRLRPELPRVERKTSDEIKVKSVRKLVIMILKKLYIPLSVDPNSFKS